jgi:hypothetical protein
MFPPPPIPQSVTTKTLQKECIAHYFNISKRTSMTVALWGFSTEFYVFRVTNNTRQVNINYNLMQGREPNH